MRRKDNWVNSYDYILNQLFKYDYTNIEHLHILKLKIWVLDDEILKEENLIDNDYDNPLNHRRSLENELTFFDKYIRTKDKKLKRYEDPFSSFVRNRKISQRDFITKINPDTGKRYEKWQQDYDVRPTRLTNAQFDSLYTAYKIKEQNNELSNAFDIITKLDNITIDNRKVQQENSILLYLHPNIQEENIKIAAIKEKQKEDIHFVKEMKRTHDELIKLILELKPDNPEEILGLNSGEGFDEENASMNLSMDIKSIDKFEGKTFTNTFESTASMFKIKLKYLSDNIVMLTIILKGDIPDGKLFFYVYNGTEWIKEGNIWSTSTNEYGIRIDTASTYIKVAEEVITNTYAIANIDRTGAETESAYAEYVNFHFTCKFIPDSTLDITFVGGYPEGSKFLLYINNEWLWHTATLVIKNSNGKISGVTILSLPKEANKIKLILKNGNELIVDIDRSGKPTVSDDTVIKDSGDAGNSGSIDSDFISTATDFSINVKYEKNNIVTTEVVLRTSGAGMILFFYYFDNNVWNKVSGFTSTSTNKYTFTVSQNATYIKLLDTTSGKYAIAKINKTGSGSSSSDNTTEIIGDIVICNFPTIRINVAENKNDPSHKGIIIEQLGEGGYRFKTKSGDDLITNFDMPPPDSGKYINEVEPFLDGEVEWDFNNWLYAYYFTETKKTAENTEEGSVPSVSEESNTYLRQLGINKDSFNPQQHIRYIELNKRWTNFNELRERQLANIGIRVQLESMFNATVPNMLPDMQKVFMDRKEEKVNITNILKDFCIFAEFN